MNIEDWKFACEDCRAVSSGQGRRHYCERHQERIPSAIDVFDSSLASLRKLWSDSPETYAMVVDAVCKREELLAAMKEIVKGEGAFSLNHKQHAINTIESMKSIAREAIVKAEGNHGA